ncbi:alkaline serine protease P32 [Purpureocillium lilacinum]|uniref:Alkaline serine protease P32 n=1 Tax=Purpureocillium lilacinum TaxID=33203 RepID=A0A179HS36_PURLI|nr:alkaline serine protease P32 [Purpureocillium lilacinum]OAQ92371.1 alkaline serine protease P32 [Purpureocillium lilacinum]
MQLSLFFAFLPLVLASPSATVKAKRSSPAPLLVPRGEVVARDSYIVKFNDDVSSSVVDEAVRQVPGDVQRIYGDVFKGLVGTLDEKTLSSLRNRPEVDFVEVNGILSETRVDTQAGADWGLGSTSTRDDVFTFDNSGGKGTCVYIIDSGLKDTLEEFQGNAEQVKSFVRGQETDVTGHGTAIAGVIGSKTYGVAKHAKLLGVKIVNDTGQGQEADLIKAFNFVASDAKKRKCPKGVIVNVSLACNHAENVDRAAASLTNLGIFVVTGAGNAHADACELSPGSEPSVCTVASTNRKKRFAPWSNWGKCVNILAPGEEIKTVDLDGGELVVSGTSLAAPHVAGVAAYLQGLQDKGARMNARELMAHILQLATKNAIGGVPYGTPNLLLFNGGGAKVQRPESPDRQGSRWALFRTSRARHGVA